MKNISLFVTSITIILWGYYNNIIISSLMVLFLIIFNKNNIKNIAFYTKLSFYLSILLFITIFYHFIKISPIDFAPNLIKSLPLILFPLLTIEYFSKENNIRLNYIFKNINKKFIKIDRYFIGISLIIINNQSKYNTEILLSYFIAWVLYKKRKILYILQLTFAIILVTLALIIEPQIELLYKTTVKYIINNISNKNLDLLKLNTAIGEIGELKEINQIDYRLKIIKGNLPKYLRLSDYSLYYDGSWLNKEYNFKKFKPKNEEIANSFYLISSFNEKEVIPSPINLIKIEEKNTSFYNSENFTIKREGKNIYSKIKLTYSKNSNDRIINDNDLKIPKNELMAIENIINRLKLNKIDNPKIILEKLNNFFEEEYKYSLKLEKNTSKTTNLGNFLLNSKKGHCEYFASATSLILRRLGIRSRYTVGYYVQEYSNLENLYILRTRHRHAWTRVYIDNKWINYDTTPSSWYEIETNNFPIIYKLNDIFSFLYYKLKEKNILQLKYLLILLIIVFILLQRKKINFKLNFKLKNKELRKIDKILKQNKIQRDKNIPLMKFIQDLNINEDDKKILKKLIDKYYENEFSK